MILAIDPGSKCAGWALFNDDKALVECGLLRAETLDEMMEAADSLESYIFSNGGHPLRAVIECPQSYGDRSKQKGDQNDLIKIALVGGLIVGVIHPYSLQLVLPREWKKQVPEDIMAMRIYNHLAPHEKTKLTEVMPKSLRHNCEDAVGIGLWACGHMKAGGG